MDTWEFSLDKMSLFCYEFLLFIQMDLEGTVD